MLPSPLKRLFLMIFCSDIHPEATVAVFAEPLYRSQYAFWELAYRINTQVPMPSVIIRNIIHLKCVPESELFDKAF
jgi:hypothetical protein